jgi:hypothetical protein
MRLFWCIALLGYLSTVQAQIPVEILAGDKKATFDLMFFKFFKNNTDQNTKWLFFSRERASIDYQQSASAFLPQFGFTEAVSYNHPALKGFAPVLVGQILNRGTAAKTGIQYAHVSKHFTFFSWAVTELNKETSQDLFVLLRFTPALNDKIKFYSQLESFNIFPSVETKVFSFTQRLRLGLKIREWQFGLGADFNQSGRKKYTHSENSGVFLRHEF